MDENEARVHKDMNETYVTGSGLDLCPVMQLTLSHTV